MHMNIILWYSTFRISDQITPLYCPHMVKVDRYSTTLRGCSCGSRICQMGGCQPKGGGTNPLLGFSPNNCKKVKKIWTKEGSSLRAHPPQ